MIKIYKEYLPLTVNDPIYTQTQGKLLTIEQQKDRVVLYFDAKSEYYHKYIIYLVETGKEVDVEGAKYYKTLMLLNGDYVLHVYIKEIE